MRARLSCITCILSIVVAQTLLAQKPDSLILQADTAYQHKRYVECSIFYELAIAAGANDPITLYNASCCFALSGRKEKAFNYLGKSIDQGFSQAEHMEQDSDLVSLHPDPRWKQIIDKARSKGQDVKLMDQRDAIINDLNNIAAQAYQYRIRPSSMGGGNGSYLGFMLPERMRSNSNATYRAIIMSPDIVELLATSPQAKGTISAKLNGDGRMVEWVFSGEFRRLR